MAKKQEKQNSISTNLNWYPGHMAKTKREVKEKLSLIDIVYEVIDARIPKSSKNKDIDELTKNKPRILIMTKIDLCDLEETNKWIKYYENSGYQVIPLDLINNPNIEPILKKTNNLLQELNNKRKEKGLKERKARALILGVPNVGKSTLINRLVGKKATNVGNKPGVTKQLEWIRMLKKYPQNIKTRYNIEKELDMIDILDKIGHKIGAIRNKEIDYDKVYNTVLKDLREGYLGKVTFDNYEESQSVIVCK